MSPKPAWNSRFKKASAAKKTERKPKPVEQENIQTVKAVDPRPILEAYGYKVTPAGKQYSVMREGDEYFRSTFKNGSWVHCDHYGNGIGDNIALVRHLAPEKSFSEAVYSLYDPARPIPNVRTMAYQEPKTISKPKLPISSAQAEARGRYYLQQRGISPGTIKSAEMAGFLCHTHDAVLIIGRDEKSEIRAITKRAVDDAVEIQKRDLMHSDKSFPAMLSGNPKSVFVVEGGMDAMALHDLAHKTAQEPPTVIVSGGSNNRSFIDNPHVRKILEEAERITICHENEKTPEIQARTDEQHEKQAERIRAILSRPVPVQSYKPPKQHKDLAEQNQATPTQEQRAEAERRRAAAERQRRWQQMRDRETLDTADTMHSQGYDSEQIIEELAEQLRKKGFSSPGAKVYAQATAVESSLDDVQDRHEIERMHDIIYQIMEIENEDQGADTATDAAEDAVENASMAMAAAEQANQVENDIEQALEPPVAPEFSESGESDKEEESTSIPAPIPGGDGDNAPEIVATGTTSGYSGKTQGQAMIEKWDVETKAYVAKQDASEARSRKPRMR